MSSGMAITAFAVSLLLAILLHEVGHLVTAKRFGMRADRYFVGFGPTLWSTRRGETEYGLKAFPLGGFVSIRGMSPVDERRPPVVDELLDADALARDRRRAAGADGDPLAQPNLPEVTFERLARVLDERGTPRDVADRIVRRFREGLPPHPTAADARRVLHEVLVTEVGDSRRLGDLPHRVLRGDEGRFFHDRPAWQRTIVLAAGSATHFVIAVVALFVAYAFLPQLTLQPVVEAVEDGSPAEEAGIEAGDRLVAVQGVTSDDYTVLRDAIRERPDQTTELTVERDGVPVDLTAVPTPVTDPVTEETIGQIGFFPSIEETRLGPVEAMGTTLVGEPSVLSPGGFVPMFTGSIEALVRVFSPDGIGNLVTTATGGQERTTDGAISVVGAASIAGQAAAAGSQGAILFLALIASINVFIGIFNLVPLPPLDGGHLAALGVERSVNAWRRLRGRAADYTVDPRALALIAIPVLAVLLTVFVAVLYLDITNPIQLG